MRVRSLGLRTDLMVRRLAESVIVDRGAYLVVRTAANPTFFWGNFMVVPSPVTAGDAARWLATFSKEFPDAAHIAIGIDSTDGRVGEVGEFQDAGLTVEVDTVVTAGALRQPQQLSVDAVVRRVASDDDWEQLNELRLAVAGDDGPTSTKDRRYLQCRLEEARALVNRGHGAFFGAFVDGRMRSGLGLVGDGTRWARFQDVETHPGFRRRGLASALVYEAGQFGLTTLGAATLVIVADPGGPAIGLYRSVGFVDAERQVELSRRVPSIRLIADKRGGPV